MQRVVTVCQVLFETLQKANHHTKIGYRRSGVMYGNKEVHLQRIEQGNGMGPTLWTLIRIKLIQMMFKAGHGVTLLSSTSLHVMNLVYFAFLSTTLI